MPLLAFEMLGLKVEPVFGIKGRGAGRLMFERGEVNIDYQTSSAFLSKVTPLVEEGKAVPIMTWGALDAAGNIVRDPTFPDLPTFKEVYTQVKGSAPSGEGWEAWKAFFVAGFPAQKMVFLPKGTPSDVIDAYVAAFDAVLARPDFAEISRKRLGVYPQATGEKAKSLPQDGHRGGPDGHRLDQGLAEGSIRRIAVAPGHPGARHPAPRVRRHRSRRAGRLRRQPVAPHPSAYRAAARRGVANAFPRIR